jgi:thiamine-phosphate pyrophosphorylase
MIRCYVTDRRQGDLLTFASRAIHDHVDMIQVREKDLSTRELLTLVYAIRDLAIGTSTRVLVNDRLDLAITGGIDGVHLPGNGLPAERVRPFVGLLGVSTHSLSEVQAAQQAGADFVIFGPIFDTPGKSAVGVQALREVTSAVRIPVLAIGGVTLHNIPLVLEAGATGIAAIRLFQGPV